MWITVCILLDNNTLSEERSVQLILVLFKFTDTLLMDSWEISGRTPDSEIRSKDRVTMGSISYDIGSLSPVYE